MVYVQIFQRCKGQGHLVADMGAPLSYLTVIKINKN